MHTTLPSQRAASPTERRSAGFWHVWGLWVIAVGLGELLGFGVPAVLGAASYAVGLPDAALAFVVIVGGMGEGAVLGLAQWLVLRRFLPGIKRAHWVGATAIGALIAWVIGMGMANLGPALFDANLALFVLLAITCGIVFLLTMGGAQWLVLRRHVSKAWRWIVANAVAWPLGVAVPVVGMALVPDGATAAVMLVVGIASGIGMGLVVGAVTGVALVRLLRDA